MSGNQYERDKEIATNFHSITLGIALGEMLAAKHVALEELDLSWNALSQSCEALLAGVLRCSSLKKLDLSWNGLGGGLGGNDCQRGEAVLLARCLAQLDGLEFSNNRIRLGYMLVFLQEAGR